MKYKIVFMFKLIYLSKFIVYIIKCINLTVVTNLLIQAIPLVGRYQFFFFKILYSFHSYTIQLKH